MPRLAKPILPALLALALAACAGAEGPGAGTPAIGQARAADPALVLPDWRDPEPAGTLRAGALLGAPVQGPDGPVGRVADIAVGPDDRVAAVLVEGPAGRLALPWDALVPAEGALLARRAPGPGAARDPAPGPGAWSARALVGDPVTLEDDQPYGTVEDLSFAADGTLRAVIVRPEGAAAEPLAFPFFGARYGFDPGAGRYRLPYGAEALG
jgi:hypothetical protein